MTNLDAGPFRCLSSVCPRPRFLRDVEAERTTQLAVGIAIARMVVPNGSSRSAIQIGVRQLVLERGRVQRHHGAQIMTVELRHDRRERLHEIFGLRLQDEGIGTCVPSLAEKYDSRVENHRYLWRRLM